MNADFVYDLNEVIDKLQSLLSDYSDETDAVLTAALANVEEALDILEDADVWLGNDDDDDDDDDGDGGER